MNDQLAVITPSFARDFKLCTELNESVLQFFPGDTKHYLIVDRRDLALFAPLKGDRTIVVAVEDVIPAGYFKVSKRWWFSVPAFFPAKGWLIQQIVKLSADSVASERILINVDSDVRFIRPVDKSLFERDGKIRMYRQPAGVQAGMPHVAWHHNVAKLLGIAPDPLPMDDYTGNMISWDRKIVAAARTRVETVTGQPWHVAYTRARKVAEYFTYGLFVDKVIGQQAAGVFIDERPWCHTYWGPHPLPASEADDFVAQLRDDDVAFSIGGYTNTEAEVIERATRLAVQRASGQAG
jgi:hypothetical protein